MTKAIDDHGGVCRTIGEIIVLAAVILAFAYLFYALLRPEKF